MNVLSKEEKRNLINRYNELSESQEELIAQYAEDHDPAKAALIKEHTQLMEGIIKMMHSEDNTISATDVAKITSTLMIATAILLFETRGPITGKLGSAMTKVVF